MKQIKMNVTGRVQGVGFRYMTKMVADKLHINGYAKNLDDGSVEIMAEGDTDAINQFIEDVKASPSPQGRVDHYTLEWCHDLPFQTGFRAL